MSLFPAYADGSLNNESAEKEPTTQWLENESFQASTSQLQTATSSHILEANSIRDSHSSSCSSSTDSSFSSETELDATKNTEKLDCLKKKKRKKSKKHKNKEKEAPILEFDGSEDYYVDKKPAINYKTIRTLHKPACPRYYRYSKHWLHNDGAAYVSKENIKYKSTKRYFREFKSVKPSAAVALALDENEYTLRLGQLNRKVMEAPNDLQNWLDLISLQERNPYKWSRLMLAEKKMDIIKRAMAFHQRNDTLYRMFIDTVSNTYPSFEVTKLLDELLSKDSYSYVLWTAQIMTTQGSMARCIVPDVLRIYERCMQKMHHSQKQTATILDTDVIMLRLFNNCALFLRQAGLYEQFFALIKLALELNISTSQFSDLQPSDDDQKTLIEYEELILQSGLPMNEIWLRIEKLRQCFNFLPCPANSKCSDPQRIVFNEDVCSYIYPLKQSDNSFYLMLLILRLLKLPFVQCDGLATKFSARVDAIGDSDAVEEALAVGVRSSLEPDQFEFFCSLHELSREMVVTPTFLSSSIAHEIYAKVVRDVLIKASAAYGGIDERKRIIFLLLLCRFERLLLVLEKAAQKLTPEFIKSSRSRFKSLLKQPANRSCLPLYTELALFEYATLKPADSLESVQKTFENIIESMNNEELGHTYLSYAEILIDRRMQEEAFQVLASYVLKVDIKQRNTIGTARRLAALKQISERVDSLIAVERNVEIMVLEQYLLNDLTVTMLKMRCLLQYLTGQKLETLAFLDKSLNVFCCNNERHRFLRERIFEIYLYIARLPGSNCLVSNGALSVKLFEAIKSYPRNLFFLQVCGTLMLPWYRIRSAMLGEEPNVLAVTFLIAAARYRFLSTFKQTSSISSLMPWTRVTESDLKHNESIVRNRILNIFRILTENDIDVQNDKQAAGHKVLRRNALFWRLYLRCLSDQSTAFETSKKCLLTALDDCPWNKSLYMDGATYVPQELSHLQDLMIEKQLRVYALPEELEILRER